MDNDNVQSVHEAALIVEQRPAQAQHREYHQQWYDTLMDQGASACASSAGGGAKSFAEVWSFQADGFIGRKKTINLTFLFSDTHVQKKRGKLGGREFFTETGNRNRNIRKQHRFPNVSKIRSRNTQEQPIAETQSFFQRRGAYGCLDLFCNVDLDLRRNSYASKSVWIVEQKCPYSLEEVKH